MWSAAVLTALAISVCGCETSAGPRAGIVGTAVTGTLDISSGASNITDVPPRPHRKPWVPPSPAPLTLDANGGRLVMRVGDQREIRLAPTGLGNWDPLTVDPDGPVTIVGEIGGYPGGAPLVATVSATAVGRTVVRTGTDLACFHMTPPCLPPVMGFTLIVSVRR